MFIAILYGIQLKKTNTSEQNKIQQARNDDATVENYEQ